MEETHHEISPFHEVDPSEVSEVNIEASSSSSISIIIVIMLLTALYYASICSDASALLLCSSINLPRPRYSLGTRLTPV